MGSAAQGLGTIASGVGSAITSGISYLGWKGGSQQAPTGNQGGKMTGFGSDNYQGYMGGGAGPGNYAGGSSIYNPPGGNTYQGIGNGNDTEP
jgi:hypothetical protein